MGEEENRQSKEEKLNKIGMTLGFVMIVLTMGLVFYFFKLNSEIQEKFQKVTPVAQEKSQEKSGKE